MELLQYPCCFGDSVAADLRSVFPWCWRRATLIVASFLPIPAFHPAFPPACHPSPSPSTPRFPFLSFPLLPVPCKSASTSEPLSPCNHPSSSYSARFAASLHQPRAQWVFGNEEYIATGSNSSNARKGNAAASWIAQNYVATTNLCKCKA